MNEKYLNTVRLMLAIAPDVFHTERFAMKGGTALNVFVQDMPRLSVDIDVVMTDHRPARAEALAIISDELARTSDAIVRQGLKVSFSKIASPNKIKGDDVKLTAYSDDAEVKVEVNYVFRGTLLPVVSRQIVPRAQEMFRVDFEIPTLADAELYGSKLVAALDRQHPRDIFDILHMYDTYGLREDFVDAFVGYLAGHNRPPHEVIGAKQKSMDNEYHASFVGMTVDAVSLETLVDVQTRLHRELPKALTRKHKDFLISLVKLEPDWSLMPYAHLEEMPAIRWKMENLLKLKKKDISRFAEQETLLIQSFERYSQA
jgi:predicted nucleotidyltransferase component of viral defense system